MPSQREKLTKQRCSEITTGETYAHLKIGAENTLPEKQATALRNSHTARAPWNNATGIQHTARIETSISCFAQERQISSKSEG